jgi:DnaJ-domain-containing protein 1
VGQNHSNQKSVLTKAVFIEKINLNFLTYHFRNMITKMLIEIFQAIIEDPTIRKLLGNFDVHKRSDTDLETLMDELGLSGADRAKFREAYKEYQSNPSQTYEKYNYKYEPKSDNPFDKFDAYYQKFEDQAKAHEEKYGKGTGDWRHRQYKKYRDDAGSDSFNDSKSNNFNTQDFISNEEKKHYESLEIKAGASFDEIKTAYKNAMKKYHPDKFTSENQKKYAESLSMRINAAYDYFKKKFNKS